MEKNDLKHMIVLLEEVSLADFQDADFIDVFMSVFKEWLVTNKGVIVQKFPISYLLKKYGQNFADDFMIDESLRDDWEDNVNYWTLIQIGRVLVSKGIAMIPSLNQNEKLTEKFKKQIDFFVRQMNLPPFVKIQFHEEKPQDVTISVVVDFPEYVKSNNTISKNYYKEILSFFSNYLGIEIGNPIHGETRFSNGGTDFVGVDDWVKTVLNKKIKPGIKDTEFGKLIRSIKFILDSRGGVELKLSFPSSVSWNRKSDVRTEVRNYLQSQGYSSNIFSLTI